MAKKSEKNSKRGDGKETFSVTMPNQPDHAANYRKVTGEEQKNRK